jgi:hypothetical protein
MATNLTFVAMFTLLCCLQVAIMPPSIPTFQPCAMQG